VVAALGWARAVLIPIALAMLLAFLLNPVVGGLRRWNVPRAPATLLVVVLISLLLGVGSWALSGQVTALGDDLPGYTETIKAKIAELRRTGRGNMLDRARRAVDEVVGALEKPTQGGGRPEPRPLPVVVRGDAGTLLRRLSAFFEPVTTTGFTMLLVIFMLIEHQQLRDRFIRLAGYGRIPVTTRALDEAGERIGRYLLTQSIVNAGLGLLFGVGLALIGVPYALLWAVILALGRYVPYVGVWVAVALPTALSVVIFDGWREPTMVFGLAAGLEVLVNTVIEPVLYSQRAGLSKVALVTAVAFWTWLWGPIGLILATPLTVCLVVVAKYVPPLDFIVVLLSDEPALEDSVAFYQRLVAMDRAEAAEILEERLAAEPAPEVYERVIVGALVHARSDRLRGRLDADEERTVVGLAGEVVEELPAQAPSGAALKVRVLGCPARDAADEIGLRLLRRLLEPTSNVEIIPAGLLSAEVVARVEAARPPVVCVVALPPGGVAHTRYLVKRLRDRLPATRIIVGRWCAGEAAEEQRRQLLAAGADHVGATLAETRNELLVSPVASAPGVAAAA
jgi:predicted PurR-regulated permease PerM